MGLGALAAVLTFLDELLRVVPRSPGVRQHDGEELAGEDRARQKCAERLRLQEEPHDDRREHGEQAGRHQLAERGPRADVHDPAIFGELGALHDPGVLAELLPHLDDHLGRCPTHRSDGERGEQERHRAADEQTHQDVGMVDPDGEVTCLGVQGAQHGRLE